MGHSIGTSGWPGEPANVNVWWAAREGRLQWVGTGETKGNKGILLANVNVCWVWRMREGVISHTVQTDE